MFAPAEFLSLQIAVAAWQSVVAPVVVGKLLIENYFGFEFVGAVAVVPLAGKAVAEKLAALALVNLAAIVMAIALFFVVVASIEAAQVVEAVLSEPVHLEEQCDAYLIESSVQAAEEYRLVFDLD